MKRCPTCNSECEDKNHFCTKCGTFLPQPKFCNKCGTRINEGERFCTHCGERIENDFPMTTPQNAQNETVQKTEEPVILGQNGLQKQNTSPVNGIEEETQEVVNRQVEGKSDNLNENSENFSEEVNLLGESHQNSGTNKTKILVGIIAVVVIIAGVVFWLYREGYFGSKVTMEAENADTPEASYAQEKLANGMTIVTYKIKKSFDFKGKNSLCDKSEFDYEIDWPIDGPQPLLNKCRTWIYQQLKGNDNPVNGELSSNSLRLAIEERIKNNSPSYDLECDASGGIVEDKIIIRIKADDAKTCLTSHIAVLGCGAPRTNYIDETYNILNTGEEMTYSLFPPIEYMRPFIWSHLLNWDEPVECAYGNYWDIDYPEQLPTIVDDENFFFQWPVSRTENLTATIPLSEVYPILSAQLRKFLPAKYADASESNADPNNPKPTRELLFSYGNEGVINENNEYISKEFRELIKLAALLPSNYPCGIGSYDEILCFWEGIDLDGSAVYDAQILSVSDNQALGVVTFGSKEFNVSRKVTLIKEKFVDPDGKTATRWVVDDYEDDYNGGKKKLLKETINEAGEAFSQGLGQRLMNDPEVGGDMTVAEKREYLQQVDDFLKAYKIFKSKM